MVIDHFKSTGKGFNGSGLEENYEDVFKLANRKTQEGLIVWRWTADGENWTRQNSYQSDLAINGIDDWGATWMEWSLRRSPESIRSGFGRRSARLMA